MGNLVGQYARLARAGSGYNQQRTVIVNDGFSLAVVEFVEQVHKAQIEATGLIKLRRYLFFPNFALSNH